MKAIIFSFIGFLIIGCSQPGSIQQKESFKDSVVKQYFSIVDSLDFYDTTEYSYKILKAYMHDDTLFFKKTKERLDKHVDYYDFYGLGSCILPKKLSDLPVDEAYRFIHSESFCDFGQAVTINKTGDSVSLRFVEYILPGPDGKRVSFINKKKAEYTVDSNCVVVKQFDKSLQLKDWNKLIQAIINTDYWGLTPISPRLMLDGSSWKIDAYTKQPKYSTNQQVHSVSRQSPSMKGFIELGQLFIKLSGEKTMCGSFD